MNHTGRQGAIKQYAQTLTLGEITVNSAGGFAGDVAHGGFAGDGALGDFAGHVAHGGFAK